MKVFSGRLALQQRVLPTYRVPFFDLLGFACQSGFSLYAGNPLSAEGIASGDGLTAGEFCHGRNLNLGDPSSKTYLCWQRGLVRWLADWDPDALIIELNPRILSTRLAVGWMRRRGRPVLGWGLGVPSRGNLIERAARLSFLRSLDGVLAYSQRGAAEYQAAGIKRVTVAHNAVAQRPSQAPTPRPVIQGDRPVVLFVGRLQTRKRIDILLRACRDVPAQIKPRLVIVGDGPARREFEGLAQEIYPDAVFTGARHGEELAPFFDTADLFALPGTGGLAVQQAMTYGLPIIVAQGDGTQDDLVRPENGWQVPPDDPDAFTTAFREALSNPAKLRRMGAESYRIVAEEINLEAMVGSFVDALTGIKV